MKTTFSWLKDHLETDASLDKIVERLSMLGLVVDEVSNPGQGLQDFKVAEVLEVTPHPNADRLNICLVTAGGEELTIVCGAPNVHKGMKGVLAPIGAVIPSSGKTLKLGKIRDVESQGMLCSAFELNPVNESDGTILELDSAAPVGAPYAQVIGLDDPMIDIEITPNRGDCLGAHGVARDLAAFGLGTLKPLLNKAVPGQFQSNIQVKIDSDAKDVCPMFAGRLIRGVQNKPSPEWLQNRLRAIGLRPISALVDITNYLSYDIGRPMHVFDADKLQGNVNIRLARADETIKALDENEYTLEDSMVVVADDSQAHSIAGVIGGEESGCTLATTNVFVESAVFDALSITMTGRKLNVLTDSRYRFERGVDASMVVPAMEMATAFILEHCGGEASEVILAGQEPAAKPAIAFRPKRVQELVGIDLSDQEIETILSSLGFKVEQSSGDSWQVKAPTWRHDASIEADLVEEIARIHGYDDIHAAELPKAPMQAAIDPVGHERRQRSWAMRRALANQGLTETLTWSFLKRDIAKLFGGGEKSLRLVNPISADLSDMRPCLLPNLLEACVRNFDHGRGATALFEVGPQFKDPTPAGQSFAVAGVHLGGTHDRHWLQQSRTIDVFDAKADALVALQACGINTEKLQLTTDAPDWYHPGRSGVLRMGPKNCLAYFGEIHPRVCKYMDVQGIALGFEVMLSALPRTGKGQKPLVLSPYQPVERDFAFVVDQEMPAEKVIKAVRKADSSLIRRVTVFDVYSGQGVPVGQKSLALSVQLEPRQATLTDGEISSLSDKIVDQVKRDTGGTLRQ